MKIGKNNKETVTNLNSHLLYFLQDELEWTELNSIQQKTIPHILNKENTLVIAPTASGKTEAVLIPIFNDILNNNLKGTSTLYISPLKALINDMDKRIYKWTKYFHLSTMRWHGDVSNHQKSKFLKNPDNFLLITPESLEVIFFNKTNKEKKKIFGNLKYIIIDEIHYFAGSDRGIQLNSLLNRLNEYSENNIKIGLSATVGNPEDVAKWLNPKHPATIVKDNSFRNLEYKVTDLRDNGEKSIINALNKNINKKVLIFARSRSNVEEFSNFIKNDLNVKTVLLHHSSIHKNKREENERKFKNSEYSAFMLSTSTLELGIDIGNIDMVVQTSPTNSVSSFLQRVGRSGRKSKKQRAKILCRGPLEILTATAELSLIKEHYVESINIPTSAKDIFIHQMLSILYEKGSMKIPKLYHILHSAYVFSNISKEEYLHIIQHLIEIDLIKNNQGYITLKSKFRKDWGAMNYRDFYSVFAPRTEFIVKNGKDEIGTLDPFFIGRLKMGKSFILAGDSWDVNLIDYERFIVYVSHSKDFVNIPIWISLKPMLDYTISRRIYDILLGNFDTNILDNFNKKTILDLKNYTNYVQLFDLDNSQTIINTNKEGNDVKTYIYSFAGDKVNLVLTNLIATKIKISDIIISPIGFSFKQEEGTINDIIKLYNNINSLISNGEVDLVIEEYLNDFIRNKFMKYLPIDEQKKLKKEMMFDIDNLIDLSKNTKAIYLNNFNLRSLII